MSPQLPYNGLHEPTLGKMTESYAPVVFSSRKVQRPRQCCCCCCSANIPAGYTGPPGLQDSGLKQMWGEDGRCVNVQKIYGHIICR